MATLLVLQRRGRATAAEIADELEVSVKTARRDLEALAMSGVPVYPLRGRGGGWELVGGARTDLTGLTAEEATALFLVAGPGAAVTPAARAALRKLVQALPPRFRAEAEQAAGAVVIDPPSWGAPPPVEPPHLAALQDAVVRAVQVRIRYTDARGAASDRTVHPLGLVWKGTTWYLVADTERGLRTFRVWRVAAVEVTADPARRPPGFDLRDAWQRIVARLDEGVGLRRVSVLVDVEALPWVRQQFRQRCEILDEQPDGRFAAELGFPGAHGDPARELCAYGGALEVLEPADVRDRLLELAEATLRRHDRAPGRRRSTGTGRPHPTAR